MTDYISDIMFNDVLPNFKLNTKIFSNYLIINFQKKYLVYLGHYKLYVSDICQNICLLKYILLGLFSFKF